MKIIGKVKVLSLLFLSFFAVVKISQAFDLGFKKRSYIYVVGSSTVSPFISSVAEEYSRNANLQHYLTKTPIMETTGTREGFHLFCQGNGYNFPDFNAASRHINQEEIDLCQKNKVGEITEIKIGYDGIVIGKFSGSKKLNLSEEQLFLALAQKVVDQKTGQLIDNPYKKWSDIDKKLPNSAITIYGPPLTSGTRDVFNDLVMEKICLNKKEFAAAYPDYAQRKKICSQIRQDGNFIESGENDNLIVTNLKNDHNALGIFGFNFLIANRNKIQAVKIDGVEPDFATISSKKYAFSRPLFVYFKQDHLKLMPQMRDFIKELISVDTIGSNGYLLNNGLVTMGNDELNKVRSNILSRVD